METKTRLTLAPQNNRFHGVGGKAAPKRGTYTEPSTIEGMEWICKNGRKLALVNKEA